MELYKGRPDNIDGRLIREIRTYDFLDRLGIQYDRTDHEAATTMEACEEIDRVLGVVMCKNLFLCNRQKTRFYLLLMPGDKKFKTKELSSQIGSARLSFAGEEDMLKYLDIEPGAVSVMGLMNDKDREVQLLIDRDILEDLSYQLVGQFGIENVLALFPFCADEVAGIHAYTVLHHRSHDVRAQALSIADDGILGLSAQVVNQIDTIEDALQLVEELIYIIK